MRLDCAVGDETRRLVEAYNDAWNRQDLEQVCSFHADGFVFENHTAGERAEGPEAARAHIEGIFERWPTLRFTTRSLFAADDFAVCEWTAGAVRPDGKHIEWEGVDVFPVGAGKLLRKDVYSSAHIARVLDE
jgi:ketosteroid isomerase-like protein